MKPIVIVGTGLAGYTLAREWRKHDQTRPLVMITNDDGAFYSKPMLSNALAQSKTAADLATANATKMAGDLNADIKTRTRVARLEPDARRINTDAGEVVDYHKLVLAVGASPIRLSLAGDAADQVLSVNNLTDYACFRQHLSGKQNVLVMGPGLIGCEFANDLIGDGYTVTVVGPDATPLGRMLPEAAGEQLKAALESLGVRWELTNTVSSINKQDKQLRVQLDNNRVLSADLVLSAVGLRPNTELAQRAGLVVSRGIKVDRMLRTSNENIFALGDCAEVAGLVLPYVMPLMNAARALAKTLAGDPTPVTYPVMPVVIKTPACPVVVQPPPAETPGQWHIENREAGIVARFLGEQNELLGFALTAGAVAEKSILMKEVPPLLV